VPIQRHLRSDYRGEGKDGLGQVYFGLKRLREDLRNEFDRRVAAVQADADLTVSGKQKKLRALATEYREHPQVAHFEKLLKEQRAREAELRAKLTARPRGKVSENADEAVRAAFAEHRAIMRFEALTPEQRRVAVRIAL
jgi:hypothetical protein